MAEQNCIVKDGSLVWRTGRVWGFVEPTTNNMYLEENIKFIDYKPLNALDVPKGKGSFKKSFHFIGKPLKDKIDFWITTGWTKTHVIYENNQFSINTESGSEAVRKRWAIEDGLIPPTHHIRKYIKKCQDSYNIYADLEYKQALLFQRFQNIQQSPIYPKHMYQQPTYQQPVKPSLETTNQSESNISQTKEPSNIEEKRQQDTLVKANWEWLRSEIYIRDKGICWVCNDFVTLRDYDLGHLVDRVNGGNDELSNCAVMHKQCNISKPRHKTLDEAMKWRLQPNLIKIGYKRRNTHSINQPQLI